MNWQKNSGALALVLEDEAIDYTLYSRYGSDDADEITECLCQASKEILNVTLPEGANKEMYKMFHEDYEKKVVEFLTTDWKDMNMYNENVDWLTKQLEKYKTPSKIALNQSYLPFGNVLPIELQEEILNYNEKQCSLLEEYINWHVKPLIDYMNRKIEWLNENSLSE